MVLVSTAATPVPAHERALVSAFPPPPDEVREALEAMETMRNGKPDEIELLGDTDNLPVPWSPTTCPPGTRQQLWLWCDDVAGWINSHYMWRTALMIPACWPRHPHICQELPVLACLHFDALSSTSPELLEDWHRQTLPQFLERMATRLGESSCRSNHDEWPARARYATFTSKKAVQERHDLFHADTHPPVALNSPRLVRA